MQKSKMKFGIWIVLGMELSWQQMVESDILGTDEDGLSIRSEIVRLQKPLIIITDENRPFMQLYL